MSRRQQWMQYVRGAARDVRLALTGRAEAGLPPYRMRFVGAGEFRSVGDDLTSILIANGLRPGHRVLDIGCGVGRVALPLAAYIVPPGRYDGFDVVGKAVRWCRRNISAAHPNFHFAHVQLFNSYYNRRGSPASEFRFPYEDDAFDFVFAFSVFTHLDPATMARYASESRRVLRPGGRFLATFYVLDEETETGLREGRAGIYFRHDRGDSRLFDPSDADAGIAFRREAIERAFREGWQDLRIDLGDWSGMRRGRTFQDLVIADKVG